MKTAMMLLAVTMCACGGPNESEPASCHTSIGDYTEAPDGGDYAVWQLIWNKSEAGCSCELTSFTAYNGGASGVQSQTFTGTCGSSY